MFSLPIQSLLPVGRLTQCWTAAFPTRSELTPYLLCHLFTSYQRTGEKLQRGVGKLPEFAVVFNCLDASDVKSTYWQASGARSSDACSISCAMSTTSPVGCFSLSTAGDDGGDLAPPSQEDTFLTCLLTVLCTGRRKKSHLKPTNSGARIKSGRGKLFCCSCVGRFPRGDKAVVCRMPCCCSCAGMSVY